MVRAVGQLAAVQRFAERARRGIDPRDHDGGRRSESGAERDVALDGDVEAGVGRVSRVPGLPDRGVDVTHRGLDQRGRHVHVGPVAGTAGVLDGEPVEREVLGLDADVVV